MNAQNLKHGVLAGLAGGAVFGMMMAMMGMLPTIGAMAGYPSAVYGMLVHLVLSSVIGASYAFLLGYAGGNPGGGLGHGLAYGAVWWFLGPLTLMPLFMGMGFGVNWNLGAAGQMMPSLMGHLVFGAILGWTYARLGSRAPQLVESH